MYYKETAESTELFLYTTNNGEIYRQIITAVINNLKKKVKKGIYDAEKAVDAWYNVATVGSNKYFKDYGYKFTVTDRYTVAVELAEYFEEDILNS